MKTAPVFVYLSLITVLPACSTNTTNLVAAGGGSSVAAGGSSADKAESTAGGKSTSSKTSKGGSSQKSGDSNSSAGGEESAGGSESSSTTGKSTSTGGKASSSRGGTNGTGGASKTSGSNAGGTSAQSAGGASSSKSGATTANEGGQTTTTAATTGNYALPPPSQCHNQDYIDYQEGCKEGDATSKCGGKCNTINACLESSTTKPHADITFICPRFMLFSPEMIQAAKDDGNEAFNYAIVGHDTDKGGIDGNADSTCCQCYQLVYAYPSPNNDRQCLSNPDNASNPSSGIPIPPPLIVQSFNTAATPKTFDVYMAAGGLGANNACATITVNGQTLKSISGQYLYSAYPGIGQPSGGGVKPVTHYNTECKTDRQWVTTETLSSDACQNKVKAACNEIESSIPGLTEQARNSCIKSNSPDSPYHLNWSVYVAKVECPEHLTQVTGCKLASQGLPAVKRDVTTAEKAKADSDFRTKTSSGSEMYETTTMEDCCRPSCASMDWIAGKGLKTDGLYNSFYSCDAKGVPITEKQ